jgi:hypothetical protein
LLLSALAPESLLWAGAVAVGCSRQKKTVLFFPLLVLGFVAPLILSVSDMSFLVFCCEFDFFLQLLFPAVHNN